MMHFWSKFGKPHFIWFWLIARTNSQAQNGVNLDFQAQFDLEDHCQSPHKTIGILIKVFYISDPNLVILAWTVGELSHGQAHDWRTHRHTHIHTHTQATTITEGQNWPRVKTDLEDPRSRSCVRSKLKSQCESNILSTHIPLVLCQSALPFLRYSIFKIWLENPSEWVSD